MTNLILFLIAALPVFLIAFYIYKKDKDKEPSGLLAKLFFAGIASTFLTLFISVILSIIIPFFKGDISNYNTIEIFMYAMIGVALIEESSKWIMLYFFSYNDKAFDELYDMIVYATFVTLGFAFFENLLYVGSSNLQQGIFIGILRALISVPGHACDGIFMGYYLGLSKIAERNGNFHLKKKNIFLSILIPTLLHGVFDFCLFSKNYLFLIAFFIFVGILFAKAIKKVNQISKIEKPKRYLDNYCPNCGYIVNSNYCPMCGRKNN